jgi:hypothetical protein
MTVLEIKKVSRLMGAWIAQWYNVRLGLDGRGLESWRGLGIFPHRRRVQTVSGAHPASYPVGTRALSLGIKRPEHEADHSPPSSADIKNA